MARAKFRTAVQKSGETRRQRLIATSQNQPKSTKNPRSIVPAPQSVRIMERYASGQSIRRIAREEKRDRATITKIVRSDEMQDYVRQLREKFYALGADALGSVEFALREGNDGRLGYRLLTDLGVVPSSEERNAIALQQPRYDITALTPFELSMAEEEDGQIDHVSFGCACVLEESEKWFGTPLPTAAQVHHYRKLMKEAKETEAGWHHQISMGSAAAGDQIRRFPLKNVWSVDGRQPRLPHGSRKALRGINTQKMG